MAKTTAGLPFYNLYSLSSLSTTQNIDIEQDKERPAAATQAYNSARFSPKEIV
jgi:hypothetical protein